MSAIVSEAGVDPTGGDSPRMSLGAAGIMVGFAMLFGVFASQTLNVTEPVSDLFRAALHAMDDAPPPVATNADEPESSGDLRAVAGCSLTVVAPHVTLGRRGMSVVGNGDATCSVGKNLVGVVCLQVQDTELGIWRSIRCATDDVVGGTSVAATDLATTSRSCPNSARLYRTKLTLQGSAEGRTGRLVKTSEASQLACR